MYKLLQALRHPMALAAATALFSGVIATGVVRIWQNHDKSLELQRIHAEQELDLKSRLVREIGATSASLLGTAAAGASSQSVGGAYRSFQVGSARIASQLAAYFPPTTQILWRDYSYQVRSLYYLLTSPPGKTRNRWLVALSRYLRVKPIAIDGLCFPASTPGGQPRAVYQEDLREVTIRLQARETLIVEAVVGSGSALTHERSAPAHVLRPAGPVDTRPCDRYAILG